MDENDDIDWRGMGGELAAAGAMADAIASKAPNEIAAIDADALALMRGVLADQIDVARALILTFEQAEARLAIPTCAARFSRRR